MSGLGRVRHVVPPCHRFQSRDAAPVGLGLKLVTRPIVVPLSLDLQQKSGLERHRSQKAVADLERARRHVAICRGLPGGRECILFSFREPLRTGRK